MSDSRISGLHQLDIAARLDRLAENGWLADSDAELLKSGQQVLRASVADRMVENVVGVFGLPLAIAPNFIVNGRDYVVPMVVEEPSVVAALSNAARQARPAGFTAQIDEWLVAGQVYVTGVADIEAAIAALQSRKAELLEQANAVHPRLPEYGGGVVELDFESLALPDGSAIAVHIFVDTGNAMGANIVNTICESIAPRIGTLCNGDIALRILSNLADRSLVTASVNYATEALTANDLSGEQVRDRIVTASDIAIADPYRAATHNKGVMNGIDAVALATGNDWRAIEAGAHAYAATSGRYQPLATWQVADDGSLWGEIKLPVRVATVGGTLQANKAAALALRLLGVESSRELAQLMAAVGLAQNYAAVRALVTDGIQKGHMRMHARSKAHSRQADTELHESPDGLAAGKVILLGEHAVVYGKHALALPIAAAVSARVVERRADESQYVRRLQDFIQQQLQISDDASGIDLRTKLPPGMGLGVSAAMAVAVIRAINSSHSLGMDDSAVNALAFECEKLAHGDPSGIDNSIATQAIPMLFKKSDELKSQQIAITAPPIVIAFGSQRGSTLQQVAGVRARYQDQPQHYDAIFSAIDDLVLAAANALRDEHYIELGALMNTAHGLLNALGVSTPELESMVAIARAAGAAGAKLTGGGGGGSIVAMCPGSTTDVVEALNASGFKTLLLADWEDAK